MLSQTIFLSRRLTCESRHVAPRVRVREHVSECVYVGSSEGARKLRYTFFNSNLMAISFISHAHEEQRLLHGLVEGSAEGAGAAH